MTPLEDTTVLLEKLAEYFRDVPNVVFAFLFGSYATSRPIKESDIDIALFFEGEYQLDQIKKIWGDVESLTRKDVDLVVLNKAAPLVAFAALQGKAIIIKNYARYLDYMLAMSSEALDFAAYLQDLWDMRRKFRSGEALA